MKSEDVLFHFGTEVVKLDKNARVISGVYPSTFIDKSLDTLLGI